MGLLDRIQAKIELFRLEQRYTRRRNRRSTFVSNAIYVDGEYIYQTPANTGSSTDTSTDDASSPVSPPPHHQQQQQQQEKAGKRLNRFSSMPGFGSLSKAPSRSAVQEWREGRNSVSEAR